MEGLKLDLKMVNQDMSARNRKGGNVKVGDTILSGFIEEFGRLPLDEKEYAIEVLKKQLIEAKRDAIHKKAQSALSDFRKGKVKTGTAKDLQRDLDH